METNRPRITPQGFVGVFIVLLGIVFTLDNLGLVESRQVLQYWPLAPLGIGLLIVIHAAETRDWIRGCVWLTAGTLFLARNLGWIHFRVESFWPLLLVAFGLHIIFKARNEPTDVIDRRVARLRRKQERWQRRAERWKARHPDRPMPGGTDWANQWNRKWQETQSKFQEDWQHKFHEKFHEDWQDKLKHTIQHFATGTSDKPGTSDKGERHDAPIDINVPANLSGSGAAGPTASGGPGVPPANPGSTTGGAGAGSASTFGGDPKAAPPSGFGAGWDSASRSSVGPDPYDTRVPPSNAPHRISMFALMGGG